MADQRNSSTGGEVHGPADKQAKIASDRPAPRGSWLWSVTAGATALALGIAAVAGVWFLRRPLAILFLGLTLASALAPIVDWLEQWLSRNLATILVYVALALILIGLGAAIIPVIVAQAEQLVDRAPEYAAEVEAWVEERLGLTEGLPYQQFLSQITGLASTLATLPVRISSSLVDTLLVVFISLYALLLLPSTRKTILSLVPADRENRVQNTLGRIAHTMGGYFRGATISGAIIGSATYIALLLIGVDFAVVLALVGGLSEFIPFIGPFIAGAFIVIVSFLESPTKALISLIFVIALQQVESNIIAPNVMHPQTCISPLATVVAIFAGWTIGGVLGALVAIPLYAALRVIAVDVVFPAIRRQTGAEPDDSGQTC